MKIPADVSVDSEVAIGPVGEAFSIQAALRVSLPGVDKPLADQLVELAHKICPYSNATRNNIEVMLSVA